MTDQNPNESSPPSGDPFADAGDDSTAGDGSANAKGSEWLAQLQTMINDITTQAAPVARQVAAKAAELTAVAAVKAGPIAQRAAEVTTDAGQKLAERAQSLAAELRAADAGDSAGGEATGFDNGADASGAEATFEDATDSTTDGAPTTSFESGSSGDDRTQTPGI
jgi:hypothetical protein